ncbi:MAG: hypothetical protein M4579_001568 [Chaenotheca gracillima]|nr:MAG: hypothetical protein M4579_001568 [Chaenotheca gracillima]
MAMMGAPLSNIAPCPTLSVKKNERKRSFIRLPSTSGSSRGEKLRPTKSVSYSNTVLPGMRFYSGSSRFSKDARKKPETQDNSNGTILKAVPQAEGASSKDQSKGTPSQFPDSIKSPVESRRIPLVDIKHPDASLQRETPDAPSLGPSPPSSEPSSEQVDGFLGVWKDGTIEWAQEPQRPASTDGSKSAEKVEGLDEGSILEVPVKLEQRPPRPKIQLTIPDTKQSESFVSIPETLPNKRYSTAARSRSISPLVLDGHARSNSNDTTLRMYVKSPPANASQNQPKLQRPFSVATSVPTIRGLGLEQALMPTEWSSPSQSTSSDETGDDDAASCYSHVSSASSVESDPVVKRPVSKSGSVAFSIMSPAAAGVFDEPPPLPGISRVLSNQLSTIDLSNKPLPPEPKEMAPAPLFISNGTHRTIPTQSPSEKDSPQVAKQRPGSLPALPQINAGKRRSRSSKISLKSKYSTTELDALDKAFERSGPSISKRPTLHEAQEALERQLSTISEHSSARPQKETSLPEEPIAEETLPEMNNPLQISRGPMDMAPSRAPPPTPPPNQQNQPLKSKPLQMTRAPSRQSLGHVATQMKASTSVSIQSPASVKSPTLLSNPPPPPPRRSDTRNSTSRWTPKAQKILGRRGSDDSDSPSSYLSAASSSESLPTSPSMSSGNSPRTPHTTDPAVAEVHKRLELLQMKQSEEYSMRHSELTPFRADFQLPIQAPSPDLRNTPWADKPQIIIPRQDEAAGPLERRGRKSGDAVPSLVSLAVSDIPEMYANMPSSAKHEDAEDSDDEADRSISAEAAEAVLLRILQSLDNLRDLFAAAVVSKGFYRTFKRNELPLMKNALRQMSPAAWELREMSPPYDDSEEVDDEFPVPDYTPTSYLRYFTRDMYIMVALKSLILVRCESFLRPETVSALAGNDDERSLQLDAAFWRVWTFCKIFGSNKGREDDIVGQMDWLRGGLIANQETCSSLTTSGPSPGLASALLNPPESFAKGNPGGLSPGELWDMMEIWTCLGTLIEGFFGKCEMARENGVFDNLDIAEGDIEKESIMLEEWISYILSLGPSVIIDLATPSDQPGPNGFSLAAENGWTDWDAPVQGGSRATFLKEAVVRCYEEQVVTKSRSPSPASSSSSSSTKSDNTRVYERQRIANHAAEIRARRKDPKFTLLPPSDERPMSNWQAALQRFHAQTPSPTASSPLQTVSPATSKQPKLQQVDEPSDKAVWKMKGMGFSAEMAKKALAETDTGEHLNLQAAISLCLKWTGGAPQVNDFAQQPSTFESGKPMPMYA